ncbi:gamma-mobile-trio protein GmtX [Massilia eurypsychrophila]|uniref:gamma-mobile-trio protein GmtX n=1 Tax=Massilia eurypsychrophila TaxID=1485217 RepID=UPI0022771764|nr:gamma-mobile-trio protein GmtX [Massilia eurypsychrophila]
MDRRPLGATVASATGERPVAVLSMVAQLTPSEREALQKAVSAEFLEARGLIEGSHGEIKNDLGRTLFDVGFGRAIRKVLGQ